MYVCHHPASKVPWPHEGLMCVHPKTPISQVIGQPNRSAMARPGKNAETGSCEPIIFVIATQKWPQTSGPKHEIARKLTNYSSSLQQSTPVVRFHIRFQWVVCVRDKIIPTHMDFDIYKQFIRWDYIYIIEWHYCKWRLIVSHCCCKTWISGIRKAILKYWAINHFISHFFHDETVFNLCFYQWEMMAFHIREYVHILFLMQQLTSHENNINIVI